MNIKWTSAKGHIGFPGLLSVETVDGNIRAMVVQGTDGPVRISHRDYQGLQFAAPAQPETRTWYRVSGEVEGLQVSPSYFDDKYDADRLARKCDGLSVSEVNCVVNDDGSRGPEVAGAK